MAAQHQQGQLVVAARRCLLRELADRLLPAPTGRLTAQQFDPAARGDGDQPVLGIVGYAVDRPLLDGDVAFATSTDSIAATPEGMTEGFRLWYRVTLGLRRTGGRWLITHEHESVPFEMDGSFRASVDLNP